MNHKKSFSHMLWKTVHFPGLLFLIILSGCSSNSTDWEAINEEGSFLVYRRQSLIGEETFSVRSNEDSIIVKSLQGENERGRISGVEAELLLTKDWSPIHYINRRIANDDTTNIFKMEVTQSSVSFWEKDLDPVTQTAPDVFFPVHSNIPAAMEMMLYHYYFNQKEQKKIPTFPRGQVSITHKGQDVVSIKGEDVRLDRYVVEGINWGGRTIWLDESKNLIAVVKANTQIRELIKKGYEEALPHFIAGNVEEQMKALSNYTKELKGEQTDILALLGGDLVDGLSESTQKDMTLIIENGRIKTIGPRNEVEIPSNAKTIDVSGKTLIPGLWDMHAHSNQVQWAPAYLAGGITTIRDNGNEIELATAFRDAVALQGEMGPDILLAGMTDGEGITGNGIIRATSPEQAKEVVSMYFEKGYRQIKIYNGIQAEILKILAEEAHAKGMTVTGHIPVAVGNTIEAVNSGMDQLSHSDRFLSVLFPGKSSSELGGTYLAENDISTEQIQQAANFLIKNKTVLDPTISIFTVRSLPAGTPIETVEPDAPRIAYELFEGKRFRIGPNPGIAAKRKKHNEIALKVIGEFFKAGVPIVAGTDNVVPVFSLYLEIETYHKLAGLTPLEAIQTATIIPARAMGLDSETGTLEIGKEADIAILDKNPLVDINHIRTVSAVMTNGNYYPSEPLWRAADFKAER